MLIKTKLINWLCVVTIGLCIGSANAADNKQQSHKGECSRQDLEKYWDYQFAKSTQSIYDDTGASHMKPPLSPKTMSSCSEFSLNQLKKPFEKNGK